MALALFVCHSLFKEKPVHAVRRQTDAAEKAGMIPKHIAMQVIQSALPSHVAVIK